MNHTELIEMIDQLEYELKTGAYDVEIMPKMYNLLEEYKEMKYNTHRYIVETAPQYTNDWAPTAYSNDFDTALNEAREAIYNDQCARIYDMFADRLIEF